MSIAFSGTAMPIGLGKYELSKTWIQLFALYYIYLLSQIIKALDDMHIKS